MGHFPLGKKAVDRIQFAAKHIECRISVRPTASQTRTLPGTGIIGAPGASSCQPPDRRQHTAQRPVIHAAGKAQLDPAGGLNFYQARCFAPGLRRGRLRRPGRFYAFAARSLRCRQQGNISRIISHMDRHEPCRWQPAVAKLTFAKLFSPAEDDIRVHAVSVGHRRHRGVRGKSFIQNF